MPAIHENYTCHVCGKSHALYFAQGAAPDQSKQFYCICPSSDFAVRVASTSGWKPVGAGPRVRYRCSGVS